MDLRLVALALVFPSTILLPVCVYDVHRAFDEPDSFEFWIGVVGHFSTIVLLDCGLRFAGELWDEEMRKRPPDKPLPQPDPLPLLQGAVLVLVQLLGLGTYATTMDGGVLFSATRWVYLAYAVPALIIGVGRWRAWTPAERLFLRWGWAPILAFGLPLALPWLRAAGLVRGALD